MSCSWQSEEAGKSPPTLLIGTQPIALALSCPWRTLLLTIWIQMQSQSACLSPALKFCFVYLFIPPLFSREPELTSLPFRLCNCRRAFCHLKMHLHWLVNALGYINWPLYQNAGAEGSVEGWKAGYLTERLCSRSPTLNDSISICTICLEYLISRTWCVWLRNIPKFIYNSAPQWNEALFNWLIQRRFSALLNLKNGIWILEEMNSLPR